MVCIILFCSLMADRDNWQFRCYSDGNVTDTPVIEDENTACDRIPFSHRVQLVILMFLVSSPAGQGLQISQPASLNCYRKAIKHIKQ